MSSLSVAPVDIFLVFSASFEMYLVNIWWQIAGRGFSLFPSLWQGRLAGGKDGEGVEESAMRKLYPGLKYVLEIVLIMKKEDLWN